MHLLRTLSAGLLAIAAGQAADRPNFVIVLADDLGYAALSCNGGALVQTPNLDRLATEGLRFTNCHVQPLCTPTRVGLLTGRGNRRNYAGFGDIDPRETTFAQVLKQGGYATAVAGKWQLGDKAAGPKQAGFDTCSIRDLAYPDQPKWTRYWGGTLEVDGVQQRLGEDVFAADVQLAWSLRWIDAQRDRPFLLYLPTPLTHAVFATAPDTYTAGEPTPGIAKQLGPKAFPSLLGHLDRQMGVLTSHLRQRGLDRDTLFIFLGDNGTQMTIPLVDGGTEQPGKARTSNPGTHSPCIAWWPGTVQPGVAADLVSEVDILPTLAELARVQPPQRELDGVSLAPRLLRGEPSPRRSIYHWYSPHGEKPVIWAQDARWKLYGDGRLFDTVADRSERTPLIGTAGEAGEARTRLQAVLDQQATIPEPQFKRGKQDDNN